MEVSLLVLIIALFLFLFLHSYAIKETILVVTTRTTDKTSLGCSPLQLTKEFCLKLLTGTWIGSGIGISITSISYFYLYNF